jgi:hypothetical protein
LGVRLWCHCHADGDALPVTHISGDLRWHSSEDSSIETNQKVSHFSMIDDKSPLSIIRTEIFRDKRPMLDARITVPRPHGNDSLILLPLRETRELEASTWSVSRSPRINRHRSCSEIILCMWTRNHEHNNQRIMDQNRIWIRKMR